MRQSDREPGEVQSKTKNLSTEPDVAVSLTNPKARPEPKSGLRSLTD